MALHEKKIPFKSHLVNITKGEQYQPWFLEINPRGEVPVLKDGVKIIPDSGRILDYLEDNFRNGGTPQLIPKDQGLEVRQRVVHFRSILDQLPSGPITFGSFLHSDLVGTPKLPFIAPVRRILQAADKNGANSLREHAANNPKSRDILLQKAELHEKKHQSVVNRAEFLKALEQVDAALSEVESELTSHGPDKSDWWLCCPNFTVADIALTILLDRLNCLGLEQQFWTEGKRPQLEQYYKRVQNRESYRRAIPSTFVHFQLLVMMQTPLAVGTCVVAALTLLVGGYYFLKRK